MLLHHVFGEVNGKKGAWGHAIGGMGAITQAMARGGARARRRNPHRMRRSTRVVVSGGAARAVVLADGTRDRRALRGRPIVNPKLLYLNLIDADELDADFRRAHAQITAANPATLRMNVALSELPDFSALPGRETQPHHQSGIIMAPSLAYMERAYFDARTTAGRASRSSKC